MKTEGLIDTTSKITCLLLKFFENKINKLKNCKILPIVGTCLAGATGLNPINPSKYEYKLKIIDGKLFIIKTYPLPMRLRGLVTSDIKNLLKLWYY